MIPGIGLVNLLWHRLENQESIPIDYRVYDKDSDGKTKNTHFCEMLKLAKDRGFKPNAVVMDAWYSSLGNLKTIRSHDFVFVTTLRKNRIVNKNIQIGTLDIPETGLVVHLAQGLKALLLFSRQRAKNGPHQIMYVRTWRILPVLR